MAPSLLSPLVSVIIVNYRVPEFLRQCIHSLADAALFTRTEIIVVDNASGDDSETIITKQFPFVTWLGLKSNAGFSKACNVGARNALGEFLLFLNPDTLVSHTTLSAAVEFFNQTANAGIVGPKILNGDGTLQVGCKRSFPTPAVAFYRLSGLSRIFPHSRRFGRYNLTYLSPDQTAEVDAISGSCFWIRRTLFEHIEGFDERFFMYGEDLDLCAKVKHSGFGVWYHPITSIIHFKGKSSGKRSVASRLAFYQAMILFSRKYRQTYGTFFPDWLISFAVLLQAGITLGTGMVAHGKAVIIDIVCINSMLVLSLLIRFDFFKFNNPYDISNAGMMLFMHLFCSSCYIGALVYRKVYRRDRAVLVNVLAAGTGASVVFMAFLFFVKSMAYSRIAFGFAALGITACLALWRLMVPRALGHIRKFMYSTGRVIVLGNGPIAKRLLKDLEADPTAAVLGIIWPQSGKLPSEMNGYPVLGSLSDIPRILARERCNVLLIASDEAWYSYVISALSSHSVKDLTVRWVPQELCGLAPANLPASIPLKDFSV